MTSGEALLVDCPRRSSHSKHLNHV